MVSYIELGVWAFLGFFSVIGMVNGIFYSMKTQITPIKFLTWVNCFTAIYAILYFVGRLLNNCIFIKAGFISINIAILLITWFFRKIFGSRRNYATLHRIQLIFATSAVVSSLILSPELTENNIIFPTWERISMVIVMMLLGYFIIDYVIFNYKIIRDRALPKTFNVFPTILIICGSLTLGLYILAIIDLIPLYFALLPVLCGFSSYAIFIAKTPSIIFITPIEPIKFEIVTKHGIPLFSKSTNHLSEDPVVRGAITALHHIFKAYVDQSSKLQTLQFNNLICYVDWRDDFFVVYIDKYYSDFIQKRLKCFSDELETALQDRLDTWDGDVREFPEIPSLFTKHLHFLTLFMKLPH